MSDDPSIQGLIMGLFDRLQAIRKDLSEQRDQVRSDLTAARSAIMDRIDRAQDTLNAMRDDIGVNSGQAEAVRAAQDNTRTEMRALGDQLAAMERQIRRLQTDGAS